MCNFSTVFWTKEIKLYTACGYVPFILFRDKMEIASKVQTGIVMAAEAKMTSDPAYSVTLYLKCETQGHLHPG